MSLKNITVSANYTLSFARDQGSGSFFAAPTSGSPNRVEWAPSGQDRRHTLNLTLAKAFTPEIEVTAIARLARDLVNRLRQRLRCQLVSLPAQGVHGSREGMGVQFFIGSGCGAAAGSEGESEEAHVTRVS